MMSKKEKAAEYFTQGLNCAQSVIGALSAELGLEPGTVGAVSSGFGGGMGGYPENMWCSHRGNNGYWV